MKISNHLLINQNKRKEEEPRNKCKWVKKQELMMYQAPNLRGEVIRRVIISIIKVVLVTMIPA